MEAKVKRMSTGDVFQRLAGISRQQLAAIDALARIALLDQLIRSGRDAPK